MKRIICIFFILLCSFYGHAYERAPTVNDDLWNRVQPYLLPQDHPARAVLDELFTVKRPSLSMQTLEKNGFKCHKNSRWMNVVVAKHNKLKGYLLKIYTDDQVGMEEVHKWERRIEGVRAIKKAIKKYHFQDIMVTPKKWIYPLPIPNSPLPPGFHQKHFILVVEDMKLISNNANFSCWSSHGVSSELLSAIYIILDEVGLYDSVYPTNIPFNKYGEIAFVDTEWHHRWPVPFHKLTKFLPAGMRGTWEYLIRNNGPHGYKTEH